MSAHYADGTLQASYEAELLIAQALDLATLLELPDGTAYVGVVGTNGGCTANVALSEFTLTTPGFAGASATDG